MSDLERRIRSLGCKVRIAVQHITLMERRLTIGCQPSKAGALSALHSLRTRLNRAICNLADGQVKAARDDLDAAEALAAQVLRAVGKE